MVEPIIRKDTPTQEEPVLESNWDDNEYFDGLQIDWKDGLPKDSTEEVTNESTLYTAGLTSLYSSLKRRLDGDDEAAQEEMERIKQEQAEKTLGEFAAGAGVAPPGVEDVQGSANILSQVRSQQQQQANDAAQAQKEAGTSG
jgi:hypothetical protein